MIHFVRIKKAERKKRAKPGEKRKVRETTTITPTNQNNKYSSLGGQTSSQTADEDGKDTLGRHMLMNHAHFHVHYDTYFMSLPTLVAPAS